MNSHFDSTTYAITTYTNTYLFIQYNNVITNTDFCPGRTPAEGDRKADMRRCRGLAEIITQ